MTIEPPAQSLAAACDRLGTALTAFSEVAAEAFAATVAIESGRDLPRLSGALDVLAARVVEVQRAVEAYRTLVGMAESGYELRHRAQN